MVEISSKNVSQSAVDFGTKNAWARYVRRRWPNNAVKGAMREWRLSEGEAKGLVYAQASQPTIDKVLRFDPLKGFGIGLEILAILTGVQLENFIEHQAEEARNEQARHAADERRLEALATRISGGGGLDRRRD